MGHSWSLQETLSANLPQHPWGPGDCGMTVNDVSDDCEDEWPLAEPSLSRREQAET